MKKILCFLFLLSAMLLTIVSCDNDDEPFSLKGKTYAAPTLDIAMITETYTVYKTWRFISDTEVEETSRKNSSTGNIIGNPRMGTYLLDYPRLTVQIQETEDDLKTYECEFIDKDTFRYYWYLMNEQQIYEFKKQ